MDINLTFDLPQDGPGAGPVQVGWFRASDKGAVMYDAPERVALSQRDPAGKPVFHGQMPL
jgi:hypothetical protein